MNDGLINRPMDGAIKFYLFWRGKKNVASSEAVVLCPDKCAYKLWGFIFYIDFTSFWHPTFH